MAPIYHQISVLDHDDYRQYLKDVIAFGKGEKKGFNQGVLAQKSKLSAATLNMVLKGKRNLSKKMATALAMTLGLEHAELTYFETLVSYNQARESDKKRHYTKLESIRLRKDGRAKMIRFFSDWRLSVVRELATLTDFQDDYRTLGNLCRPNLIESITRKLVNKLEELELIEKDSQGKYHQIDNLITPNGVPASATYNRTADLIDLGKQSLFTMNNKERYITSHTFSVSAKTETRIRTLLAELSEVVSRECEEGKNLEKVVQLNIQMFPLSNKISEVQNAGRLEK